MGDLDKYGTMFLMPAFKKVLGTYHVAFSFDYLFSDDAYGYSHCGKITVRLKDKYIIRLK